MQKPRGAVGATLICGALALAMVAPTNAADATNTTASAIFFSMGSSLVGEVLPTAASPPAARIVKRIPANFSVTGRRAAFQKMRSVAREEALVQKPELGCSVGDHPKVGVDWRRRIG